MIIAVIPARGGSKRIPRKNIRNFNGKPIISYPIQAAKKSNLFDKIIVSTDDNEIAKVAKCSGASLPFTRSKGLSDDNTPIHTVIKNSIFEMEKIGWDVHIVCCIFPTAVFTNANDLIASYEVLLDNPKGYVFALSEFNSNIERAIEVNGFLTTKSVMPSNQFTPTQDLQKKYFDLGQFYWAQRSTWLRLKEIHNNAKGYIIDQRPCIDIDDEKDWKTAEMYLRMLRQHDK